MSKRTRTATASKIASKAAACLCAAALAAGMVPSAALAEAADAARSSSPSAESAASEPADAEPDQAAELPDQSGRLENSWRYVDGVPIAQDSLALDGGFDTLALNDWERTGDGFVNDDGDLIPGAIAKGIDVSKWQGDIDWEAVAASDVDFAIIRCGYGSNDTSQDDAYWEANASACESLGIPYGVYLYSYALSTEEAQSEAEHVLRLLEGHSPTLPIYYDLEEDDLASSEYSSLLASMATTFCSTIEAAGYTPGIYTNLTWRNNYLTDPCFDNWDLWIAQWNSTCTYTGSYHIWQCTSSGTVDGIDGNVDLDFMIDYKYTLPNGAYNTIFNAQYYLDNNPDVKAVVGDTELAARTHFIDYGMAEGRVASPVFDVNYYRSRYSDLNNAFGDDLTLYFQHFIDCGMNELRQGSAQFNPECYMRNYADLRNAYGTSFPSYYRHYVIYGMAEGRNATSLNAGAMSNEEHRAFVEGELRATRLSADQSSLGSFTVNVELGGYGSSSVSSVEVDVWTSTDGKSKARTYAASSKGGSSWAASISTSDFGSVDATFCVQARAVGADGSTTDLGQASASIASTEGPVYRLYQPATSEHLYTTDWNECTTLYTGENWGYEGVAWSSPNAGTPVYRLYNPALGNHLYTTDSNEVGVLTASYGWVKDNDGAPLFYSGCSIPVYRVYNEALGGLHHLTANADEYNLLAGYQWAQEGVSLYTSGEGSPLAETRYYPTDING